jgi:glycosyltransferase involved in cell wall biosynthesis
MSVSTPLVSVWMITYNQEKYIAEALDSVLMQKCDFDFEIVIGEDCSTDNTRNILLEYKKKYPDKINLLLHNKNIGMIANQNATFSACKGEYIAMLEGDDFWTDENKLQIQIDYMKKYPQSNISFHPIYTTEGCIKNHYSENSMTFPTRTVIVKGGYFISTPSIMIKKEVISLLPDFLNNAPAGDYYIQIFGSLDGGALYIPHIMATYRVKAEGSWSNTITDNHIKFDFMKRTLTTIKKVDAYLKYEFSDAFQYRYLTISNHLCIDYLYNNDIQDFTTTVILCKNYVKNINFKCKFLILFQNWPRFILYTSKVFNAFKVLISNKKTC